MAPPPAAGFSFGIYEVHLIERCWHPSIVEVRVAAVKCVQEDTVGIEFLRAEADDRVSLDVFLASRSKLQAGSLA